MMKAPRSIFTQKVLPLFEQRRAEFLEDARRAAHYIASQKGEVTIDDVRAVCPPPSDVDPRVMGAVFKTSDFEVFTYRRSTRRECHNRPVAVHRLRSAA